MLVSARTLASTLLVVAALHAPDPAAAADASRMIEQGRYSLGLSGGFGKQSVSEAAGFGYFVYDGLQPAVSLGYSWAGSDAGDAHQVRTQLELRYYFVAAGWVAPFISADGAHIYLAYRGVGFDEDHNFFYVGGTLGILLIIGDHLGLQLGVGLGTYLGEDATLTDRGALEEGLVISGRFGFSIIL